MARLVAVRGSSPDKVRVLVVTKDQWSPRLNTEFSLRSGAARMLSFQFAEHNLAGRNKRLSLDFGFDPGRYSLGDVVHRLIGSGARDISSSRSADCFEPRVEPRRRWTALFSSRTTAVFAANALGWEEAGDQRHRALLFRRNDLSASGHAGESVPDVFTREQVAGQIQVQYSAGLSIKLNLALGFRMQTSSTVCPTTFLTRSPTRCVIAYRQLLPRSESASGPFVG